MSKKWPFKKSPGVVVNALIEDVETLQDEMFTLIYIVQRLRDRLDESERYVATHRHSTYPAGLNEDDGLGDIGPVL